MSQQAKNRNADRPKALCHLCKKPGHYRIQCRLLKKQQEQATQKEKKLKIVLETKTVAPITLTQKATPTILTATTTTKTVTEPKEIQKLFTHPVRHAEKQTTPQRNATLEPMQPIERVPGIEDPKDKIRSKRRPTKVTRVNLPKLQPKI